ncbi:FAD-dependent oxidoreductase [Thermotoga profunda]|uniref:FAD-dependent oxidoreductase n=1 Tax=Thermotoga profunda TaxID=1508420 RepID=UPI0008707D03|nr:FAD-dependent oxidoreductase [Thermotoga profunda]
MKTEVLVIGGGPAGLCAAIEAASYGCKVTLVDESLTLGGQLVKQTHKFFGSSNEFAGTRGIEIAKLLTQQLMSKDNIEFFLNTTAVGYYTDEKIITCMTGEQEFFVINPEKVVVATGALEKLIPFPGNDLPGIYGAGAVQTLMNVYGVVPGNRVLMIGAGNIGLIVSYQLLQAGVEVAGIVEFAPRVGGYWVHAAKIRRLGIPIYLRHTIKRALGTSWVEGAIIQAVDQKGEWCGEEKRIDCDVICLAVGLSPTCELLWQAGCEMNYVPELSGYVPKRDETMRTTHPDIWVAGDASGIEEASSAMIEGKIAGLSVAYSLGKINESVFNQKLVEYWNELNLLRGGEIASKIRDGVKKVLLHKLDNPPINIQYCAETKVQSQTIYNEEFCSGILPEDMIESVLPPLELWDRKKGGLAIIECPQPIPCDPCHTNCPTGAILPFENINDLPQIDYSKCSGCALCVASCPGLACFVVDLTHIEENKAIMKLPYEMLPKPNINEEVQCLDRKGEVVAIGKVIRVQEPKKDKTLVVHVVVPRDLVMQIRSIRVINHG